MVTQSFQQQLDLEANCQVTKQETEENLENGKEYVGITKIPYRNLMLDRRVLIIEERLAGHRLFLPQKVVRCEVWIGGLHKMHSYK
jgi:hypothetical protein